MNPPRIIGKFVFPFPRKPGPSPKKPRPMQMTAETLQLDKLHTIVLTVTTVLNRVNEKFRIFGPRVAAQTIVTTLTGDYFWS